jgi:hypothetical protein
MLDVQEGDMIGFDDEKYEIIGRAGRVIFMERKSDDGSTSPFTIEDLQELTTIGYKKLD